MPCFSNMRRLVGCAISGVLCLYASIGWAHPEGGQIVAGQGVIEQAEKETRIQQASDRLSIDWKSFDLNSDERVQFIQPNSSSIAFNRILSNKGSLIQGRIDANGQVVLVNPNGLIFTDGASVNAGGLIASALQMNDQDYLNSKFTLNALEGSEGRVINSGLLNAATGGTISLLGQSVENKGLISAQLGSVNLAAGKEAVLTFEPNGLVGVRVTQSVLQKDLGVDAAIINSGEVKVEGGKVLITASISKDIFSKAVNVGELSSAKSAVVNDDGSFTLSAGADIKNTGELNVGSEVKAGEAVLIGENITNQGSINADSQTDYAGSIEITAKNINEIRDKGSVTAIAHKSGKGGDIKLLGDKVGLLGSAKIDTSGANGGGQVLIGGDKTGNNPLIKNAQFIYLGENSRVNANALQSGDGGKLIAFADDTARIYGGLFARGGLNTGDGGFIETSGLKGFEILDSPDVSSLSGMSGAWLIDPSNIEIDAGTEPSAVRVQRTNTTQDSIVVRSSYASRNDVAKIGWTVIRDVLNNGTGGTVEIRTNGSCAQGATCTDGTIKISANLTFSDERRVGDNVVGFDSKLILAADKNIEFTDAATKLEATNNNRLNLEFTAGGDIDLNKVAISTNGGYFTATPKGTQKLSSNPDVLAAGDFKAADATISTYAAFGGGDILITAKGKADLGAMDFSYDYRNGNEFKLTQVGSINVTAGSNIILNKEFDFNDSGGYAADGTANTISDRTALTFTAGDSITLNGTIIDKEYGDGRDALGINLTAGTGNVTINQPIYTSGGSVVISGNGINQNSLINTDRANERTVVEQADGRNGNATRSEGGDVTLSSDTAVALNAITTDSFCADGKCTGNLVVQSRTTGKNINITQMDNTFLKIHGATDFIINGGTLNLTNGLNIFGTQGGSIEAQAGNAVSKTFTLGKAGNTNLAGYGLLLGTAEITGTARITATSPTASVNSITQAANSKLTVTGNTELTADTITLDNDGNNFATIISIDAATSAHVSDINGVDFNTLKTPVLTVNTQGDAHFNGPIATQDKAVAITQKGTGAVALADGLTQTGTGVVTIKGTALSAGLQYEGAQNAVWDLAEKTLVWEGKTFGFEGFSSLIGGDGVDTVRLSEAVTAIDLDNKNATGFALSKIEVIKTSASNVSLTGFKANSVWTITADKKGTIEGGGQTTAFEGFNELISSDDASNADLFTFNGSGTIGKITGQNADVVNLFTGAGGAVVDYEWAVTANTLNGITTTSAQVKHGGETTDVISALTGVGTINSSDGKDTVFASATFAGTIDLKAGVNALTTDSASLLFSNSPLKMNGFVGVNALNAKTQAASLTATTDNASATLMWTVNPAEDALSGPLSGSISYAQTGQADQTLNFNRFALLSGGANNDTFTLNSGTFTGGQVHAGTPGSTATQDRLINGVDSTVWDLSTASLRGVTFSGFNYWQGSGTDTLNGVNTTNNWVINTGQFILNAASQLSGFNVVNGGSGKDVFTINANTSGITLRGNAGADEFILADNSIQTGILDGGAGVGDDSENDTLKINSGTNSGANAWVVTAPKTGTVNSNHFSGMEILVGGTGSDTLDNTIATPIFLLTGAGAGILQSKTLGPTPIAATVTGMDTIKNTDELKGLDSGTLTWSITGTDRGAIKNATQQTLINFERVAQLTGGNANNVFELTPTGAPLTLSIVGGQGINTLKAPNTINTWTMTDATSGVAATGGATGLRFKGIQKIYGGTEKDTLDYSAVAATSPLTINAADLVSIEAVNGNGASVVLQAGNDFNIWTLNDANRGVLNDTLAFSQIVGVRGGGGKDRFIITQTSAFNGRLDGGGNTANAEDELSVDALASEFFITAQGEGALTFKNLINAPSQLKFAGIEVLNGGESVDTFRFSSALTDAANINMLLDGKGNQDSIELPKIQLEISLAAGVERTGNQGNL